jgi:hypothetical protein
MHEDTTMDHDTLAEAADEMAEIKMEMEALIDRAEAVLRGLPSEHQIIARRAEAYWIGHIKGFLTEEHRSCTSILDTIREITAAAEGRSDDDEDEDD